jgi:hypothetical protein
MVHEDAEIKLAQVKELPAPLNDKERKNRATVLLAIYDRQETIAHNTKIAIDVATISYRKSCTVEDEQVKNKGFIKGVIALGSFIMACLGIWIANKK